MTDRVALITGAAGDIGGAVAHRLAAGGMALALADHPHASRGLEVVQSRCRNGHPGLRTMTVEFDVADPDAVRDGVAEVSSTLGVPEMLFNNAGYQGQFASTLDQAFDDVARVLDVNVLGVFAVLQAVARSLREAGRPGSIVNMASMAGVGGAPNMAAYSASKAAVIGLTKSAAKDLAPLDIRVNSVSPGFIGEGAMWDNQVARQAAVSSPYYGDDEAVVADQMIEQIPLRRPGRLAEVAAAVDFLLSDEASYLTGVNLEIAGGAS